MIEQWTYHVILGWWIVLSAIIAVVLLLMPAPYGRHARSGWGPSLDAKMGWVLMEMPAVAVFAAIFFGSWGRNDAAAVLFLFMWEFHYLYRTFIFPARLQRPKPMPLTIALFGFVFNVVNGFLNGHALFGLSPALGAHWLSGPRFIIGAPIFFGGFGLHVWSDSILRNLRGPASRMQSLKRSFPYSAAATSQVDIQGQAGAAKEGYKIPTGGPYRWISCPNYLGEIVEWGGWAMATWSLAGLAFFLWTAANLMPRAIAHHRWYKRTFPDYPADRKAVIPFML